jgi:hypothetical protein
LPPALSPSASDGQSRNGVSRRTTEIRRDETAGARFVVGDVTQLRPAELGTFDFSLDAGCFQGLNPQQRLAVGRCVTGMANSGAALLMLSFGPTRLRRVIGGVSRTDVEDVLSGWNRCRSSPPTPRDWGGR